MRHTAILVLLLSAAISVGAATPDEVGADRTVAFVGVNLVPMTFGGVEAARTVVVRDGVIVAVGAADQIEVPASAVRIEGSGRWLIPGLADMHTHIGVTQSDGTPDGANQALLWLAHGVTTILNLGDQQVPRGAGLMELRDDILAGRGVGPTIMTASIGYGPDTGVGPLHTVRTADEGRDFVTSSREAGYDFIKVYGDTPPSAFAAMVEQADAEGMAVIGHVPQQVGLDAALAQGMVMVAHANQFWCAAFDCSVKRKRVADVTATLRRWRTWVNSTLYLNESFTSMYCGDRPPFDRYMAQPEIQYVHPLVVQHWTNLFNSAWRPAGCRQKDAEPGYEFILEYTKAFYDGGVRFVLGTDSPPVMGIPGHSLHEEMRILATMMTPFEVLTLATRNAGEFVGENLPDAERFGTIEVGSRADLVLLDADPLRSVENLKRRAGVMARGRWFSEHNLRRRLAVLSATYHGPTRPRVSSGRRSGEGGGRASLGSPADHELR